MLMSEKDDVTYPFDPLNPPALTDEQRARLAALAAMPDDDIDTSDIPPLADRFFARAKRNPFMRQTKSLPPKPSS